MLGIGNCLTSESMNLVCSVVLQTMSRWKWGCRSMTPSFVILARSAHDLNSLKATMSLGGVSELSSSLKSGSVSSSRSSCMWTSSACGKDGGCGTLVIPPPRCHQTYPAPALPPHHPRRRSPWLCGVGRSSTRRRSSCPWSRPWNIRSRGFQRNSHALPR